MRFAGVAAVLATAACGQNGARVPFPTEHENSEIGGFSGLEVLEGGAGFVAISDHGRIVEGRFIRENGEIVDVRIMRDRPLRRPNGQPVNQRLRDAEGLAISENGAIYVSFEGPSRVWEYDAELTARALPSASLFSSFEINNGPEALAIDAAGHLFAIPEVQVNGGAPVLLFDGESWENAFTLPLMGRYLPVGADFAPDGKLYVLERAFFGVGFQSRLRRMNADGSALEQVWESRVGSYGNLEGVSVWQDAKGTLKATMIADNNYLALFPSELVEIILPR